MSYIPPSVAGSGDFPSSFGVLVLVLLVVYAVIILAALVLSAVVYIAQSISFYTIAKRRGIHSPWLSWIPVGNMWILGSISDQYQYVKKGKERSLRKWLIGLGLGFVGVELLMSVTNIIMMVTASLDATGIITLILSILALLMSFAVMIGAIAYAIMQYMAIFDLFESCAKDRAVLYLLLSFFVPFAVTVLFFICRNKDEGMPPRLEQPEETADQEGVTDCD